jgi:hypothetical protein
MIEITSLELWLIVLIAVLFWRLHLKTLVILRLNEDKQLAVALLARVGSGMSRVKWHEESRQIEELPVK